MIFPSWKYLVAASGGIVAASYGGPKIAAKLVGPELTPMDTRINSVKEYGATIGVGVATFVLLAMVLRA